MNLTYIKNNLSLLDLITVDINTYIELHKLLKRSNKFIKCKNKFNEDNKNIDFDKIQITDLFYITTYYKDMLLDTPAEKKIKESNILFNEPNIFKEYFKNCSSALLFIFYKQNKLFTLLEKLDIELFKIVINKISDKMQLEYIKYLIEIKSNIIFTKTDFDEKQQLQKLSTFKELPEEIRPYISHSNLLLSKIKKEKTFEDKINDLLKNKNGLIEVLKNNKLNEDELKYLYEKIKPKHLNVYLLDYLPKEIKENLYKEMTIEEFDKLFLYQKEYIEKFFLDNININLYMIKDLSIEFMKKHYKKIRKSILNGTKIGKQGLKYFLIKNKEKLDKELLEYVLKKYPRFYKSLKITIKIDFDTTPYKKELTLKDCVFKEVLSEKELAFVNENINKLLKMNFQKNFSNTIKNIMINKLLS